jgi:hypothetical protein
MPEGANYHQEYIRDRANEEGLDLRDLTKEDRNFREGKEKLRLNAQFSTGEVFSASEKDGEANFAISKDGKEVFNFKALLPEGYQFTTPEYWIKLEESDAAAPFDFKTNPQKFRQEVQGVWQCGDNYISVGKMTSLRDIVALLHEIGHSRENPSEFRRARDAGDTKKEVELLSGLEWQAWDEALKDAKIIKGNIGVDVLEGFKSPVELETFIDTCMATERYVAELKTSGGLRNALQLLGVKSIFGIKTIKEINDLFDKRKS